jgi:DNA-directed RNA polymerase subunit RPC12/RpoP
MGSADHVEKRIWGQANRCPECGGRGYLDRIDLVDHEMHEHCLQCGEKFVDRQADLSSPRVY